MKSRAAAKGRKPLFLAAVCLLSALLLSPTAEASRGLPVSTAIDLEPPAPRWEAEAPPAPRLGLFHLEDEVLLEILTGVEPKDHQALLDHRRLELLPPSNGQAAIRKTASGVSTSEFQLNIKERQALKPDLRWTVPFYAKARFFDPEVGRFLTEDPAEPDLTAPPSLHKYLYAYGNPTYYTDPDGREGMGLTEQDFENIEAIKERREQAKAQKVIEALADRKAFYDRLGNFLESEDFTHSTYRTGALYSFLDQDSYSENWEFEQTSRIDRMVFGRSDLAPHIIIAGEASVHSELINWAARWFAVEPAMAVSFGMFLEEGLAAREMIRRGKLFEESVENSRKVFPEEIVEFADAPPKPRLGIEKTPKERPGSFVAKNESMSPQAQAYEDAVAGGKPGQVYRVPYDNPNPRGRPHVDFDGLQGNLPVDAKLSVVTRPKSVNQAMRQAESLAQNDAYGVWKVTSLKEAQRARKVLQKANAEQRIFIVVENP